MATATEQTAVSLPAGTWNVDPIHSTIGFEVKHFGISTFRGQFTGFEGRIETGDGTLERVEGTIRPDSVDARDPQLSAHLQSEDFFDTALAYGEGHSERLLGELVRANPDKKLYTATKIPPKNRRWPSRRASTPMTRIPNAAHIRAVSAPMPPTPTINAVDSGRYTMPSSSGSGFHS